MKAVILAGGKGTRLHPLTKAVNKHLLPVGPYPMIYWPIIKVKEAGIHEILIITQEEYLDSFKKLLGTGEELGVTLQYVIQPKATGISDGLSYAKEFINGQKFILILGDNIFEDSLLPIIKAFEQQASGGRVVVKRVNDPSRFGVAVLDDDTKRIASIVEKPKDFISNYIVTGVYFYGPEVFDYIQSISPSKRGELEITDVNNLYIQESVLQYDILPGWWVDAGTYESLHLVNGFIHEQLKKKRDG